MKTQHAKTLKVGKWCSKSVLKGKSMAVNAYLNKEEISKINNLNFCLKDTEREE